MISYSPVLLVLEFAKETFDFAGTSYLCCNIICLRTANRFQRNSTMQWRCHSSRRTSKILWKVRGDSLDISNLLMFWLPRVKVVFSNTFILETLGNLGTFVLTGLGENIRIGPINQTEGGPPVSPTIDVLRSMTSISTPVQTNMKPPFVKVTLPISPGAQLLDSNPIPALSPLRPIAPATRILPTFSTVDFVAQERRFVRLDTSTAPNTQGQTAAPCLIATLKKYPSNPTAAAAVETLESTGTPTLAASSSLLNRPIAVVGDVHVPFETDISAALVVTRSGPGERFRGGGVGHFVRTRQPTHTQAGSITARHHSSSPRPILNNTERVIPSSPLKRKRRSIIPQETAFSPTARYTLHKKLFIEGLQVLLFICICFEGNERLNSQECLPSTMESKLCRRRR